MNGSLCVTELASQEGNPDDQQRSSNGVCHAEFTVCFRHAPAQGYHIYAGGQSVGAEERVADSGPHGEPDRSGITLAVVQAGKHPHRRESRQNAERSREIIALQLDIVNEIAHLHDAGQQGGRQQERQGTPRPGQAEGGAQEEAGEDPEDDKPGCACGRVIEKLGEEASRPLQGAAGIGGQ